VARYGGESKQYVIGYECSGCGQTYSTNDKKREGTTFVLHKQDQCIIDKQMKTPLSKHRLYELYWEEEMTTSEIADACDLSVGRIRDQMTEYGIPKAGNTPRERWIADMTTVAVGIRRKIYELYWIDGMNRKEVANEIDKNCSYIKRAMYDMGIPRQDPSVSWKGEGIPRTYQFETADPRITEEPVSEMPADPNPDKYLASYDDFDKDRLYELYWGHGHDIKGTLARLDADISPSQLRDRFDRFGIPRRDVHGTNQHRRKTWLPRDGIPPKYQWPENREPKKRTEKRFATWRTPKTAKSD
jgi:hypothetical protein